jgi:hypothetical protein
MDGTEWADYVDHDSNTDTTAPLSDTWQADLLPKVCGQDDEDDVDEQLAPPAPPPSISECNNHLQRVMDFALTSNNSQLLDDVAKCLDTMSKVQQARAATATQYTMLHFFK